MQPLYLVRFQCLKKQRVNPATEPELQIRRARLLCGRVRYSIVSRGVRHPYQTGRKLAITRQATGSQTASLSFGRTSKKVAVSLEFFRSLFGNSRRLFGKSRRLFGNSRTLFGKLRRNPKSFLNKHDSFAEPVPCLI